MHSSSQYNNVEIPSPPASDVSSVSQEKSTVVVPVSQETSTDFFLSAACLLQGIGGLMMLDSQGRGAVFLSIAVLLACTGTLLACIGTLIRSVRSIIKSESLSSSSGIPGIFSNN
jgi:hypothetical protein